MRKKLTVLAICVVVGALAACTSGTATSQEYVPAAPHIIAGGALNIHEAAGGGYDVEVRLLGEDEGDSSSNMGPDRPEKPLLYRIVIELDESRDLVSIDAFLANGDPLHPDAWDYTASRGNITIELDSVLPLFEGYPAYDIKATPQDIHVIVTGRTDI